MLLQGPHVIHHWAKISENQFEKLEYCGRKYFSARNSMVTRSESSIVENLKSICNIKRSSLQMQAPREKIDKGVNETF